MFLRDAVFGSPEFKTILTKDTEALKNELIANFTRIKGNPNDGLVEKDVKLDNSDFDCERVAVDGVDLVVIKCPEPRKSPEASFIGITLGENTRYFISEYETREEMKQIYPDKQFEPGYILCEWVGKEHKNYGEIDGDITSFTSGISKLLP